MMELQTPAAGAIMPHQGSSISLNTGETVPYIHNPKIGASVFFRHPFQYHRVCQRVRHAQASTASARNDDALVHKVRWLLALLPERAQESCDVTSNMHGYYYGGTANLRCGRVVVVRRLHQYVLDIYKCRWDSDLVSTCDGDGAGALNVVVEAEVVLSVPVEDLHCFVAAKVFELHKDVAPP